MREERQQSLVLSVLKTGAGLVLALAGGVALAAYFYVSDRAYYPIARIAAPDGLTYTAFADETRGRDACDEANQRFVEDFRANCPACSVLFARCESKGEAIKLRTAVSEPVVVSRGMSIAVAGPRELAHTTCQGIVQDLTKLGLSGRCLK